MSGAAGLVGSDGTVMSGYPMSLTANIRGAIFDLDGTLLDSMGIWDTVGECYLHSLGILMPQEIKERIQTMSLQESAVCFQKQLGVQRTVEEIADGINQLIREFYLKEAKLKKGAADYLKYLSEHQVKMCIATATDRELAKAALRRCGVLEYFTDIFTCTELGVSKRVPDIYEAARAALGTKKEETVVFEDAVHALKTAKAAGFVTAGVYDASEPEQNEMRALSDYYIEAWSL